MTFLSKLSELFERVGDSESRLRGLREEELRVAAALLVNASTIDGEVAPEERRKLKALLRERFDLGDDECRRLIRESGARSRRSLRLHERARCPAGPGWSQTHHRNAVGNGDGRLWCMSSSRTSSGV